MYAFNFSKQSSHFPQILRASASTRASRDSASRFDLLRTFALIVSAHPYCARNPLRDVMPRHALSARC